MVEIFGFCQQLVTGMPQDVRDDEVREVEQEVQTLLGGSEEVQRLAQAVMLEDSNQNEVQSLARFTLFLAAMSASFSVVMGGADGGAGLSYAVTILSVGGQASLALKAHGAYGDYTKITELADCIRDRCELAIDTPLDASFHHTVPATNVREHFLPARQGILDPHGSHTGHSMDPQVHRHRSQFFQPVPDHMSQYMVQTGPHSYTWVYKKPTVKQNRSILHNQLGGGYQYATAQMGAHQNVIEPERKTGLQPQETKPARMMKQYN